MSRFSTEVVGACLASMVFGGAVVYFLLGRGKQRGVPEAAPAPDGEQRGADAGAGSGAGAGGAADGASADVDEPCKMVMVVRMDLKMGKGKIAAQVRSSAGSRARAKWSAYPGHCDRRYQCGHAVLGAYQEAQQKHQHYIDAWEEYGQKKIAVKVQSEEDMDAVAERVRAAGLPHYIVVRAAADLQI